MIAIVEHPELDWVGRFNYLSARREVRRVEDYARDLIWVLAKGHNVTDDAPMPSEILSKKQDKRSGKQILNDLINGLGGE